MTKRWPVNPDRARVKGTVYLLHLDAPFGHAKHYTGWALDLPERLREHARGTGARLLQVALSAGIGWSLARIWPGQDRYFERSQKARGASRNCPICRGRLAPEQAIHFGPTTEENGNGS